MSDDNGVTSYKSKMKNNHRPELKDHKYKSTNEGFRMKESNRQ